MIMETPPIIRVYDFNSETLLTKNLHTMRLEIKIESWSSLLNNSASILRQRRPRHDSWDHLVSIQLLLDSKNGKDRKRLQNKYLLVMKRGILSMNREAAKRMEDDDLDYENPSGTSGSSD